MALTDNILAYWKMDESIDNARSDSTGNGYDLQETNDYVDYEEGVINDAATFGGFYQGWLTYTDDGFGDQIPINKSNFSFACWFKPYDLSEDKTIAGQWDGGYEYSWILRFDGDGHLQVIGNTSTGEYHFHFLSANINLNTDNWYHCAFTYDGNDLKLYVNSQLVGVTTIGGSLTNTIPQPLVIGSHEQDNLFNGSIDEVGIWNRALSQEDIFNLYYRRDGNSYPFDKPVITQNLSDELLAWYPLDENTGTRYDFANGYDLNEKVNFVKTVIVFDAPGGEPTLASSHGTYTRSSGGLTPFNGPNNNTLTYSGGDGHWELYDDTVGNVTYAIDDEGSDVSFTNWTTRSAGGDLASTTELVYYVVGSEKGIIKGTTKDINNGLLAYWNLDNDSWLDSINNFTLSQGTGNTVISNSGLVGNAATFDGTNYLTNGAFSLPANQTFSISCFFKKINDTGQDFFLCSGASYGDLFFGFQNNQNIGFGRNLVSWDGTYNFNPTSGVWYHAVLTYDGTMIKLYLNGSLVISQNVTGTPYAMTNGIFVGAGGSDISPQTYSINGQLDELGIWDRALSSDEIHAIYNNGIGITYPLPTLKNNSAASFVGTANNGLYNTNITTWYNWSYSFWVNVRSDFSNIPISPVFLSTGNLNSGGYGDSQITYFSPITGSNLIAIKHYDDYTFDLPNSYTTTYGTWNHVTVTNNTLSGVSLYVNGNFIGSTNDQDVNRSWTLFNLDGFNDGTYQFDGLLDDVKVWNRSITPNEIASIYRSGAKTSKYTFQKVLGIPTYTFEKVTPQSILDLPFYIKSGGGGSLTIKLKTGLTAGSAGDSAYQIKTDYPNSPDGLYWIRNANINGGEAFQIYADMTTLGGGWTLILNNHTYHGWTFANAISANVLSPPSDPVTDTQNYSIIGWADYIKKSESNFDYMFDADYRGYNGAAYTALSAYSFVETPLTAPDYPNISGRGDAYQNNNGWRKNISEIVRFPYNDGSNVGVWDYNTASVEYRMPFYTNDSAYGFDGSALIATNGGTNGDGGWWGTLVSNDWNPVAPWMSNHVGSPTAIWYWVR